MTQGKEDREEQPSSSAERPHPNNNFRDPPAAFSSRLGPGEAIPGGPSSLTQGGGGTESWQWPSRKGRLTLHRHSLRSVLSFLSAGAKRPRQFQGLGELPASTRRRVSGDSTGARSDLGDELTHAAFLLPLSCSRTQSWCAYITGMVLCPSSSRMQPVSSCQAPWPTGSSPLTAFLPITEEVCSHGLGSQGYEAHKIP